MINNTLDLLGHRNRWAVATVLAYLIALSALLTAIMLAQVVGIFELRGWAEMTASAGGPIVGIALAQYAPPPVRWRIAVASTALYCLGLVVFIAPPLVELIARKPLELSLTRSLAIANMTWVAGPIVGALALACLVKLTTAGTDGFIRARGAALGDARWLDMTEASKLFPADGEVVIGEAYRPDQERSGHQAFDPGKKDTWGSGGRGPLLTYKLNFDSTHMLFFAGSGGYKTTSTVVPTALRYSGSMVVLDPAREVGQLVGPIRSEKPSDTTQV